MILTSGGRFAGYGFYLLKGKPVFLWKHGRSRTHQVGGSRCARAGSAHSGVRLQVRRDGTGTLAFNNFSGVGRPGIGTLKVDGKEVATKKMERTLPMILQWVESFDIALTRSPA